MKKLFLFIILIPLFFPLTTHATNSTSLNSIKSAGVNLHLEKIAEGFAIPWGMAFISPSKLLLTERRGRVYIIDTHSGSKTVIKNIPEVLIDGQSGLLDVAIPPNYENTLWIYFTYVKEIAEQGVTVLARAKLKNNSLTQWQELLVSKSGSNTSQHFGSRISFDESGHVYFGIGDRGERDNSQDLRNHAGTIIRLNLDGSIPKDNPFIGNISALPEIWSYGHRNPQGLSYDLKTQRLWEIEHGPRGGDEVNLISAGKNYGWPIISYGKEYWGPIAVGEGTHREGMEQPKKVYTPSIAPGSLIVYRGNAFPKWKGNLFSGALKLRHLNRLVLDDNGEAIKEERLFGFLNERIRALVQSTQGWIYFSTDSGKIYRIKPSLK